MNSESSTPPAQDVDLETRVLRRARHALVACPGCDRLYKRERLAAGEQARCLRCDVVLYTHKPHTIDRSLAAALAGLVLLIAALLLPFLTLNRNGLESQMTVIDAISVLWDGQLRWLGLLVLGMIVVLPLVRLLLLSSVLLRLRKLKASETAPNWLSRLLRWESIIEPWAMADVFMVGVVVSLVKIGELARLQLGPAFWALIGLVVCNLMLSLFYCRDSVWLRLSDQLSRRPMAPENVLHE